MMIIVIAINHDRLPVTTKRAAANLIVHKAVDEEKLCTR